MNYWWVNHKQTFRQEFGGKYVLCTKQRKDGRIRNFNVTMREVQPGALVLSYANAALQGFGFAVTHSYSCPRPNDFGQIRDAWDLKGPQANVSAALTSEGIVVRKGSICRKQFAKSATGNAIVKKRDKLGAQVILSPKRKVLNSPKTMPSNHQATRLRLCWCKPQTAGSHGKMKMARYFKL